MDDGLHRVLVIDDNPWIHDDIRKVLEAFSEDDEADRLERDLAGGAPAGRPPDRPPQLQFAVDSALQGREGVEAAGRARAEGRPYAMAFVDIRMPPGWDGIETIERLWVVDPEIQTVICSAYTDYSWDAIQRRIGGTDRLLVLKKPFDAVEIAQLAHSLARKWSLQRAGHRRVEELEALVQACTSELARAGQLGAAIADELGRMTQDIGDNLRRARASIDELALASPPAAIPAAFEAAFEGLGRIAKILRASKDLARDDKGERAAIDVNRGLLTTLEVARHAYRSVAELEAELGELPPVACVGSELNVVFRGLLLNAVSAIGAAGGGAEHRGTIRVRTWSHGDEVLISFANTGTGIRQDLRAEQRLAIARAVIGRYGGSLTVETDAGGGATFTVRLPAAGARSNGRAYVEAV